MVALKLYINQLISHNCRNYTQSSYCTYSNVCAYSCVLVYWNNSTKKSLMNPDALYYTGYRSISIATYSFYNKNKHLNNNYM